jgi:hypothetical protein
MSTAFLNRGKPAAGDSVSITKPGLPPMPKLPPIPKLPPRPKLPPSNANEQKPPMVSSRVYPPPPAEDRTQAYSSTELQRLVSRSISDAPASEDFTRQYAKEDWKRLQKRALASAPPMPEKAADVAPRVKTIDTIPDSDELTRVYVRAPDIENLVRPNTAPKARAMSTGAAELGLPNLASIPKGRLDESTQVATRYRAQGRSAWFTKAFRVLVCVGVAANILFWGNFLLNGRGKGKVPAWWKSCGGYVHHLYMEFLPTKPVTGR